MNRRRALTALYLSIMFERLGFYAFLGVYVLYQIHLGLPKAEAVAAVGYVIFSVYVATFVGGLLGQRFGFRNVSLVGLAICAAAYAELAFGASRLAWMPLLALGIGLYKPTMPIMVGAVDQSPSTMSRFYAFVNIGGMLGPLGAGLLAARGQYPLIFGLSAGCCLASQAALLWGGSYLSSAPQERLAIERALSQGVRGSFRVRRNCVQNTQAIWLMCALATLFWAGYQASFGSVEHLIETEVDRRVLGWVVPTSWFNAENGLLILVCGFLFPSLWASWKLSNRVVAGLLASAASFGLLIWGQKTGHLVAWVPATAVLVETVGELLISPMGLSKVQVLAPPDKVGLYTALWYLSSAIGGLVSGWVTSFPVIVGMSLIGAGVAWKCRGRLL